MRGLGLGLGISKRQTAAIGPWLSPLSLSASSVAESAIEGATVGTILGGTSGSTITLHAQSDADMFAKDGSAIEVGSAGLDYETETSHTITLREALAGAGNTPRDTVITITVTNVLEVTLGALTLDNDTCDDDDVQGTTVGTIQGGSSGSTITLHAQSVTNAFQKDGSDIEVGSAAPLAQGTPTITLRETHPDASNSPNDSVIPITVEAAAPTEGNELWVQPAFDASTGVTLSTINGASLPTISTGKLRCTVQDDEEEGVQPGFATATALETLAPGTYRVAYTIDSIGADMSVQVSLASNVTTTSRTTAGTFSEDIVIATASSQTIRITMAGNTDNQQVVIDNFSVKQLT